MFLFLKRNFENFLRVLLCWVPEFHRRRLHHGMGDMLFALAVLLASQLFASAFLFDYLSVEILFSTFGTASAYIVAVLIGMAALRSSDDRAEIATGLLWCMALGTLFSVYTAQDADLYDFQDYAYRSLLPFLLPSCVFLLSRFSAPHSAVVLVALVLPGALYMGEWALREAWSGASEGNAGQKAAYTPPDIEMIYARQPELLERAFDQLRPSDPNRVELFAVLGAGYADQRVFRREVEAVGYMLEESFEARDRVIQLVNSSGNTQTYPLMNRVNLRSSLSALGNAMGQEDIALIFLTSHGGEDVFSLRHWGVISRNLTPDDLNDALNDAGIGAAIVIVSACHSGSFVDELAAPNRLVLTASASDRNSFGCSDENEWTDWGRAFFTHGLTETPDPRAAARIAQSLVSTWEAERDLTPSLPQIAEGEDIGRSLEAWVADLASAMPAADALRVHAMADALGATVQDLLSPQN